MVEVLEFIFRGFWTWLGTFLLVAALVAAIASGIGSMIRIRTK